MELFTTMKGKENENATGENRADTEDTGQGPPDWWLDIYRDNQQP